MLLPITVQGDHDFVVDVLRGLVAQYDSGVLPQIAAVMVIIGLLIWSVKHSVDNEKHPHPFKELLISFLMVGVFILPNTSPRFDVQIVPINTPLDSVVVERVPFIAAVPAWAASSLIGTLTRDSQLHFGDVYGTDNTLSQLGMSPFQALVHLHSVDPTAISAERNLLLAMDTFINDCVVLAHEVPNIQSPSPEDIKSTPATSELWAVLEPHDSNWLRTKNYLTEPATENVECREVHMAIGAYINTNGFASELTTHFSSLGVQMEQTGWLPQVLGDFDTPTPQELMIGRFLAAQLNESFGNSQLAVAFGRGVFESQQQRVYQRAGEANMFLQVAKPMMTTLEAFVFFISPVMMLLAVLGGIGLAYVGKYLMILVFTNLWAYIAVFVSALNTAAVVRALNVDPGAAYVDSSAIFSYGAIGNTITEIEGGLVVAATMVAAIPMLAMFLLYGGVHSLMGVMGKFGGTYDGKSAAPSIVSTGPSGERVVGNYQDNLATAGFTASTMKSARDGSGVNIDGSAAASSISSRGSSVMEAQTSSAGLGVRQSFAEGMQSQNGISKGDGFTNMSQESWQQTASTAQSAAQKVAAGQELSGEEALALAATTGFKLPYGLFGMSATASQGIVDRFKNGEEVSASEMEDFGQAWNSMTTDQQTTTIGSSQAVTNSDAFSDTRDRANTWQRMQQQQDSFGQVSSNMQNLMAGTNLNGRDVLAQTGGNVVSDINRNLNSADVDRMRDLGMDGLFVPGSDSIDETALRNFGGINAVAERLMRGGGETDTAEDVARDMSIGQKLYDSYASHNSGPTSEGARMLANGFGDAAGVIRGGNSYADRNNGIAPVDREATAGTSERVDQGQRLVHQNRGKLGGEYKNKENNFAAAQARQAEIREGIRERVQSVEPEHGSDIAGLTRFLLGENAWDVDGNRAVEDTGRFLAIDSGQSEIATGVGYGLKTLTSDPHDKRFGINGAIDRGENNSIKAAMLAAEFLETDAGREVFSTLPSDRQESAINSIAALRYAQEEGKLDGIEDHQFISPNASIDAATNNLYKHATQGRDDLTLDERHQAYQGARFVALAASNYDSIRLSDAQTNSNRDLGYILPGFQRDNARQFIADNADYIGGMDFKNSGTRFGYKEDDFNADLNSISSRHKLSQEARENLTGAPSVSTTPTSSTPNSSDENRERVKRQNELAAARQEGARNANRDNDGLPSIDPFADENRD